MVGSKLEVTLYSFVSQSFILLQLLTQMSKNSHIRSRRVLMPNNIFVRVSTIFNSSSYLNLVELLSFQVTSATNVVLFFFAVNNKKIERHLCRLCFLKGKHALVTFIAFFKSISRHRKKLK